MCLNYGVLSIQDNDKQLLHFLYLAFVKSIAVKEIAVIFLL